MLKFIVLSVITAIIIRAGTVALFAFSPHRVAHNVVPGTCRLVEGANQGSEDMALTKSGKALISTGLGAQWSESVTPEFVLYDFKSSGNRVEKVKIKNFDDEIIIPHGFKIFQEGSEEMVYVVHHYEPKGSNDTVEKFRFDEKENTLTHIKTFRDDTFLFLNSVEVVGVDQFYYTRFLPYYNTLIGYFYLESILHMPLGGVGFFNGELGKIMASNLVAPNGIAANLRQKRLYVTESNTGFIHVYEISQLNALNKLSSFYLGDGIIDNLNFDAQGNLWSGGTFMGQGMYTLLGLFKQEPTQNRVLKMVLDTNGDIKRSYVVYSDDGKLEENILHHASVGLVSKSGDKLLIGTVAHNLMVCECPSCWLK